MKKEYKPRFTNYVPHNEFRHIDTGGDDEEDWLRNLSRVVGKACDRFLDSRGLKQKPVKDFYFGKKEEGK